MQQFEPSHTMPPLAEALLAQPLGPEPVWSMLGHLAWHPECLVSDLSQGGERFVIAGVARYGTYLRFSVADHALAEALVKATDYPELLTGAWQSAGCLVAPSQVAVFATRLLESGLIYDRRKPPQRPRPARTWRDAVQWKVPLWDPTPLLDFLAPVLRSTSRAGFLWGVWVPLLVLATVLVFGAWGEVSGEITRLFGLKEPYALAWIYGLLFLTLALHEFGHAAVCYALGAPVRQIGVMLYMGMPFGYCDVSAAHLLPRKRDRIAVSLGGLYYQMGLGALAVLVWAAIPSGEPARAIALKLAIVASTSIVFDLNPFAKLDGYYVLADWLGIPNLRDRSFAYLHARLRREPGERLAPGERRLFLGYAILGCLASAGLLVLGVLWWRRVLTSGVLG
ncbi:hypothetical protein J7643_08625 [bacterium]|nr:hypothetical protein [bacterium]